MKTSLTACSLVFVLAPLASGQGPRKPADPPRPTSSYLGGICPQGATTLCIPLDGTFVPVDMNQPGGSGTADPNDQCQRNDDDSGLFVLNGWSFRHFGTDFTDVYINNNGNISFGVPFSTFSPVGFPVQGFPMVAPFWADVDTGDINDTFGGVVYIREESVAGGDAVNRLTVIWDHVGYYNEHSDLLNTFEVILTDGLDPFIGLGNNICFCYDDMQWTTGDASGGLGGFGGSPATVGANEGNGVDFFQIGLFDHAGNDYDGPTGAVDGVSFLDDKTFCFNLSGGGQNVPPVFVNPPGTCLTMDPCEAYQFTIEAIGPESGQTVDITVDAGGLANFTCVLTPGNPASAFCTFTPDPGQIGQHIVSFTATDDATAPLSSDLDVCLDVQGDLIGTSYCQATPNSTGKTGKIVATGSDAAADEDVLLIAYDMPPGEVCLFIASMNQGFIPMPGASCGNLCVTGPIGRFKYNAAIVDANGKCELDVDPFNVLTNPPQPILGGQTWNFQTYHRDLGSGCTSNFTDAVSVAFQ